MESSCQKMVQVWADVYGCLRVFEWEVLSQHAVEQGQLRWSGHAEVSPSFPSKGVHSNQPLHVRFERGIALRGNVSFWKRPLAVCSRQRLAFDHFPHAPFHSAPVSTAGDDTPPVKTQLSFLTSPPLPAVPRQSSVSSRTRTEPQASPKACAWQPVSAAEMGTWDTSR